MGVELAAAAVGRADLLVDDKIVAFLVQVGEVLDAVVLVVAGPLIDAVYEEMVDLLRAAEPLGQVVAAFGLGIAVFRKGRGEELLLRVPVLIAVVAAQEGAHGLPVIEVGHLHGDAVLRVIDGLDDGQLIVHGDVLHDREIEVVGLGLGAGDDPSRLPVGPEPDIGIVGVIPGQDGGIILAVPAAVEVDADGLVREDLPLGGLGRHVFFRVLVIELVVMVGIRGPLPVIFHEVPEQGVEAGADPVDRIPALVAAHQTPVVVHGVKFIFFGRVVPDAGVDDDPGAVGHGPVRDADLAGGIGHEIVRGQFGQLHQAEPLAAACGRAGLEAGVNIAGIGQDGTSGPEADLTLVGARARNHPEAAGSILLRRQGDSAGLDLQIVADPVDHGREGIVILALPLKGPLSDLAVVGHKELVRVIAGPGHDRQGQGVQMVVLRGPHHGLARRTLGPVHEAVGLAVKPVHIPVQVGPVPEIKIVVAVIGTGPGRDVIAVCPVPHVPVTVAVVHAEAPAVVHLDMEGGPVVLDRSQVEIGVPCIAGIVSRIVFIQAVDIVVVLLSLDRLKIIGHSLIGRIAFGGLGLDDAGGIFVLGPDGGLPRQIIAAGRANVEPADRKGIQVLHGPDLFPAGGHGGRALHDGIGGETGRIEGHDVAVRLRPDLLCLLGVRPVTAHKVDHGKVLCSPVRIQELHLHGDRPFGLQIASLCVHDGNVKDPGIIKPARAHGQGRASQIILIFLPVQLGDLQARVSGDARLRITGDGDHIIVAVAGQDVFFDDGHNDRKDREAIRLKGDLVQGIVGRLGLGLQDPGRLLAALEVDRADLLLFAVLDGVVVADLDRDGPLGLDLLPVRHDLDIKKPDLGDLLDRRGPGRSCGSSSGVRLRGGRPPGSRAGGLRSRGTGLCPVCFFPAGFCGIGFCLICFICSGGAARAGVFVPGITICKNTIPGCFAVFVCGIAVGENGVLASFAVFVHGIAVREKGVLVFGITACERIFPGSFAVFVCGIAVREGVCSGCFFIVRVSRSSKRVLTGCFPGLRAAGCKILFRGSLSRGAGICKGIRRAGVFRESIPVREAFREDRFIRRAVPGRISICERIRQRDSGLGDV